MPQVNSRERGSYVLWLALLLPVLLGILALGVADARLLYSTRRDLQRLAEDVGIHVATTLTDELAAWRNVQSNTRSGLKAMKFRSFELSTFSFAPLTPDQEPDFWQPRPPITESHWNTAVLLSGSEKLTITYERGFQSIEEIPSGSGKFEPIFYSLEEDGSAVAGMFLNTATYAVFNAVRMTMSLEGVSPVFGGLVGITELPRIEVSAIATIDSIRPEPVAPFAIPLCELFLDTSSPDLMSEDTNIRRQVERPVKFGEAIWTNSARIDGTTRSEFYPRPATRLAQIGATGPAYPIVDADSRMIRGVLGLPSSSLVAGDTGLTADELQAPMEEYFTPTGTYLQDPPILATVGQRFIPLQSFDPPAGALGSILDNAALATTIANAMKLVGGIGSSCRHPYASTFRKAFDIRSNFALAFRPHLRRIRPELPDYPAAGQLMEPWKLQELVIGASNKPPLLAFPMGNLVENASVPNDPWSDSLSVPEVDALPPMSWVNPMCHDAALPRNKPDELCVISATAMLVAPRRADVDYCGFGEEGYDLMTADTEPIIVGYLPVILYDFNIRALDTASLPPGDRYAILQQDTNFAYDTQCAPQANSLDLYPITTISDPPLCSNYARGLATTGGTNPSLSHPADIVGFPYTWPLEVALQGLSVDGTLPAAFPTPVPGSPYPWADVENVVLPGYQSISSTAITIEDARPRKTQYGCAGFAAVIPCTERPIAMSPRRRALSQDPMSLHKPVGGIAIPMPAEQNICSYGAPRLPRIIR